ncbi:MAG: FliA/WhiG family RNA polymerase sigma factor [Bacillota bacterium]|nr:FliA/WhiG family RNA polymerase sigma factor [Bacillota bacterium]
MKTEALWVEFKEKKSKEAKDALIVEYVALVKQIVGRLFSTYGGHVEYDDLIGYGIVGLIDAVEKFDPKKQIKFETYATIRIRGAIVDQIRQMDWIPRSTRTKYKKIEDAIAKLQAEHGADVSDERIAEELGMSVEEYQKQLGEVTTYAVVSLEEKFAENPNFDIASEQVDTQPELSFEEDEVKRLLLQTIQDLPERERTVLELYYYSELTYKEIAAVLEVTESRVSQIHSKAISRLKISLASLR